MKTPSLKQQIKELLFEIYPRTVSNRDLEDLSRAKGFNCESGRKRMGDLIKVGLVKSWTERVEKLDGKTTEVVFYQAVEAPKKPQNCDLSHIRPVLGSLIQSELFPTQNKQFIYE